MTHVAVNKSGTLAACAAGKTTHLFDLAAGETFEAARKVYPPVPAGVVEAIQFFGEQQIVVSFYGGVMLWSSDINESGKQFEYGVSRPQVLPSVDLQVSNAISSCTAVINRACNCQSHWQRVLQWAFDALCAVYFVT